MVAGDGRVVDVGGAKGRDAAADSDAEQVDRPGRARCGRAVDAGDDSDTGRGAPAGAGEPA